MNAPKNAPANAARSRETLHETPSTFQLSQGLTFVIPNDWTAEQAQAVLELLDDLRDLIWAHYQRPLQDLYRQQRLPATEDDHRETDGDDPPF